MLKHVALSEPCELERLYKERMRVITIVATKLGVSNTTCISRCPFFILYTLSSGSSCNNTSHEKKKESQYFPDKPVPGVDHEFQSRKVDWYNNKQFDLIMGFF
jgi:hypothetical protein